MLYEWIIKPVWLANDENTHHKIHQHNLHCLKTLLDSTGLPIITKSVCFFIAESWLLFKTFTMYSTFIFIISSPILGT